MPYEAVCPKGHRLQVSEEHFGRQVSCPTCGAAFVVPDVRGGASPASTRPDIDKPTRFSQLAGRPLVAVGLALALLARGGDMIGQRGVESAHTKVLSAKLEATAYYDRQIRTYERRIKTEEKAKQPDMKAIDDYKESRRKMTEKRQEVSDEFEASTLPDLELAAATAAASNTWWAYYRECLFVLAAVALTIGLLAVSLIAQGAERMVCLIMLAIITASIFIGGIAWIPIPHV